jgi:aspartate aminotransferase
MMEYFDRLTRELADDLALYSAAMRDVPTGTIDLAAGEVRVPCPAALRDVMMRAAVHAEHGYVSPQGMIDLREAYCEYLRRTINVAVSPDSVLVTAGGKEADWLTYVAFARSGGRVLVPQPGWMPYVIWARASGAEAFFYDPLADVDEICQRVRAISPTMLVLNYPNNPTGRELNQVDVERLCAAARSVGAAVLSDEVYRGLGADASVSALRTGISPEVVVTDSLSKTAAFAGLRIGFLVTSARNIQQLTAMRGTIAACTSSVSQAIATALLTSPDGYQRMTDVANHCRCALSALATGLTSVGISPTSSGGIYAWARRAPSSAYEDSVLQLPGGPAVVASGKLFGEPCHVRVCSAREMAVVRGAFRQAS